METITYLLNDKYNNLTIRQLLECFHVGKSSIYKMIIEKQIYINDTLITKDNYLIHAGDRLNIETNETINFTSWNNEIEILYEDDNVLIVNKPVGVIIHPDGNNNNNNTLVNMVAYYYEKNGINRNIRYIHRIDTETSGIVVFAKDYLTYCMLSYQIEMHEIKREYLALCFGKFNKKVGKIDAAIGKDRHISNKYRVSNSENAKKAITNYVVEKMYKDYSLVRCILSTGRTHQIRVHMSYIGHPLLGDSVYGGSKTKISRVALHSYRVTLMNPITNKQIIVIASLPKDMDKLVGGFICTKQ